MPSLQNSLPPELANNAIRLYRECLRRAKYIGSKRLRYEVPVEFPLRLTLGRESRDGEKETWTMSVTCLKQYNTELLVGMVRQQFRRNMNETDPEKIQKLKDDAARGLINHMLYESEKLSGSKFSS